MSPKKKTKKKATETEIPQVNQEVPKAAEVKSEAPKAEDKPKAPKQAKSSKVSFQTWFAKKVEAKEIGHWQAPEIQAFFKKKGLSESENPDSYEEQLKSY